MRKATIILLLLAACFGVAAQEKSLVIQGNQLYQQKKYKEASAAYQQALQKNPGYTPGGFNLGNALIQQKQYDAARKVMATTAKNAKDKDQQSGANYNIGNTYMAEQKWTEAVDAYKQALRKNPQDVDAKYNLSYALAKLKQQNKDDKDKNKDNKNKDKDKKDQDKKDKDKKDGQKDKKDQDKDGQPDKPQDGNDKKDQEQKRPEPQPSKLTKQQADNLLNALQQDERKLQDKVQKGKGIPVKTDKDW